MRTSARVGVAVVVLAAAALLLRAALHREEPALPQPAAALSSPPASASSPSSAAPAVAPPASASAVALASASAVAPVTSAAPVSPVCRDLLAHNERVLDGRRGPAGVSFFTTCYPDHGGAGAWGLRLDAWSKSDDREDVETSKGQYTVVRRDAAGQVVAAAQARGIEGGLSYSEVSEPLRFDFDGDGREEIFIRQFDKEHEGASTSSATLYTLREGKVIEYPDLPRGYEGLEDVDGDGRPDVIYHPYESSRTHPGSGFDFESEGPAMVAHSLRDGTFSTTDAAAQAFARKACPTPRGPSDAGASDVEPELCARLWGATQAEAMAVLRGLCPGGAKCDAGCAESNDPCVYFEARASLLGRPPPLRLGP